MRLEDNKTDNVEELWRKFKSAVLLSLKKTTRLIARKNHGSHIIRGNKLKNKNKSK